MKVNKNTSSSDVHNLSGRLSSVISCLGLPRVATQTTEKSNTQKFLYEVHVIYIWRLWNINWQAWKYALFVAFQQLHSKLLTSNMLKLWFQRNFQSILMLSSGYKKWRFRLILNYVHNVAMQYNWI